MTVRPNTVRLRDLAKIVRSKNSGPFEITLDVVFDDPDVYRAVRDTNVLTRQLIADLYGVTPDRVMVAEYFDAAMAFKATLARSISSGGPGETDTYGGQQAAPLLDVMIPYGDHQ